MSISGNREDSASGIALGRREVLGGLGALAASGFAWAQAPTQASAANVAPLPLPLKLTTLTHHIGISVRDVVTSATFYSRLVGGTNVNGEKEPFLRYFITLRPGDEQPGDVAIGKLGTLGSTGKTTPLIDHFCVGAATYDDAAWRARLKQEGLTYIAQGVFADIDGIAVQVAGGEGGEGLSAGAITKLPPLYTGTPLLQTLGFDHVMLRVNDVERTAAFWKKMFGLSVSARESGTVWITDGARRLGWRKVAAGEQPGVEHYAIRTRPFDRAKLARELPAMGATVGSYDEVRKGLRLADPDGIKFELWQV
jgi:catechol 2,3-dioxygenase-like lactoylglutathione lyase family enzyme